MTHFRIKSLLKMPFYHIFYYVEPRKYRKINFLTKTFSQLGALIWTYYKRFADQKNMLFYVI